MQIIRIIRIIRSYGHGPAPRGFQPGILPGIEAGIEASRHAEKTRKNGPSWASQYQTTLGKPVLRAHWANQYYGPLAEPVLRAVGQVSTKGRWANLR